MPVQRQPETAEFPVSGQIGSILSEAEGVNMGFFAKRQREKAEKALAPYLIEGEQVVATSALMSDRLIPFGLVVMFVFFVTRMAVLFRFGFNPDIPTWLEILIAFAIGGALAWMSSPQSEPVGPQGTMGITTERVILLGHNLMNRPNGDMKDLHFSDIEEITLKSKFGAGNQIEISSGSMKAKYGFALLSLNEADALLSNAGVAVTAA